MAVNLHQTHFRFGVNELAESTHGWKAAEDTNVGLFADQTFLLRFTVQETGGTAAANVDNQFQYNKNGAGWNNITTSSANVKAVNGILTEAGNCTKRLSGTGTFESSGAGQTEDGLSGGNANDIAASGNSETECALQIVGTDVARGDTIQFRLTSPDFTITIDVTPQATVLANVALTADSSSYAVSGTAADLEYGRLVSAAAGSHAVTGTAADLVYTPFTGYTMPADAGVFAETGTAASLFYGREVPADAAGYAVTGTAAALEKDSRVAADAGGHTISGAVALLTAGRVVGAEAGSHAVSGAAASLEHGRAFTAAAGSVAVAGTAAGLVYSGGGAAYALTAESGAVVWTGAAVGLAVAGGQQPDVNDGAWVLLTGEYPKPQRRREPQLDLATLPPLKLPRLTAAPAPAVIVLPELRIVMDPDSPLREHLPGELTAPIGPSPAEIRRRADEQLAIALLLAA